MSLDEDLRTELLTAATTALVGSRVVQNVVPQDLGSLFPRIWYMRTDRQEEIDLAGTRGLFMTSNYDVEVSDLDIDSSISIADTIRTTLNGKYGTFGAGSVKGVFVDDHDDQYIPRSVGDDEGIHVSALRVRIVST